MNSYRFLGGVLYIQPKLFTRIWRHQKTVSRYCSARRALLYVPGSNTDLLNNALKLKVDCLVFDCEERVTPDQKDEARQNVRNILESSSKGANDPEWCVKINSVQTSELCEADINGLLSCKHLPDTICLPKIKNPNQLEWFAEKVWKVLLQRPENERGPIKLIMHIDSATAMLRLPELCQKAEDLASMAPVIPVALAFENDSMIDSIGARKTESGIEILFARQQLVLIAKAFGLQAIDKSYPLWKNFKGLKESCIDGVILGYTGKQLIHMDQIIIAQEEFTPSRSKIRWAKTVLKAFKDNEEKVQEDFGFDNSLIDISTLRQAQNIISAAVAAELEVESPDIANPALKNQINFKE